MGERELNIVVQGYPGCFHEEAARKYFPKEEFDVIPANSFTGLADIIAHDHNVEYGIMAIENSIAGSLLQNYRILRENHLWIVGEVYLRIKHNLMALPNQNINDIHEVHSHPMALNQCLRYLKRNKNFKLIETEDTALSAKLINDQKLPGVAAIASETAAEIYGLEILEEGIETSKVNYTRFFIIQKRNGQQIFEGADKVSIYLRVNHSKGSLLKVLQCIYDININISKLQSYPVLHKISEYFFHIDLEFEHTSQYESLFEKLQTLTLELEILGIYRKAPIYDHQAVK